MGIYGEHRHETRAFLTNTFIYSAVHTRSGTDFAPGCSTGFWSRMRGARESWTWQGRSQGGWLPFRGYGRQALEWVSAIIWDKEGRTQSHYIETQDL